MKMNKRKHWSTALLGALALGMVWGLPTKDSLAYFTTYATAKGGYELSLGAKTELEEKIENLSKHIEIQNTGSSDCFVRVKVLSSNLVKITPGGGSSGKWKESSDGYWYYSDILAPEAVTEPLIVDIGITQEMMDLAKDELIKSLQVVVVQECTPVLYKEDGTAYADWTLKFEDDSIKGAE